MKCMRFTFNDIIVNSVFLAFEWIKIPNSDVERSKKTEIFKYLMCCLNYV